MSNPRAKAERSKAKDARQQAAPESVRYPSPHKKPKPVIIQYRTSPRYCLRGSDWHRWTTWGRYRDTETAQNTLINLQHKYTYFEFRLEPEKRSKREALRCDKQTT